MLNKYLAIIFGILINATIREEIADIVIDIIANIDSKKSKSNKNNWHKLYSVYLSRKLFAT